ncbi:MULTISPECIES: hypothetical protein [unclassified Imperialibacter]|uniref:hypothetical protein n=1 Tax=unclassified Imperialibacter TaxID=2629706 RepID=UPI0012583CAE|nr:MULTISPECIES: hypothetical protein [unclassified Imperialibacter]CAD5248785.1 conserved hypothetical protein [Imperialibacter sp. 89]CAD5263571.1 conserved hypothetical protein [Imperialibacter sp. 75]VVT07675.1 conserved hypothetical protein [Imperialibacter sp. EC-SDR9]
MDKKAEIDKIRDSGGEANIGTEADGAVVETLSLNDKKLIIIKERAIYQLQMADDIDPDRTNINLPRMIQKLYIEQGTESELVCRTFLTAKRLLKEGCINDDVDVSKILELSLELLHELIALQTEIDNYQKKEKEVSEDYYNQQGSFKIPSIGDVTTRCKTIFQKADHIEQFMIETITVFYPNQKITKQAHFPRFHEIANKLYGPNDPLVLFVKGTLHFMLINRQLRNGLDHRLETVTVHDFQIQPDSSITSPSIQLNHKDVKLQRQSLSLFLPNIFQDFVMIYENMMAYLTDKHIKPGPLNFRVNVVPEDKRRNKSIQFSLWSPIGKDGFFDQS